ncbi:MAG: hypothetical protein RLZZ303_3423 [Candidatus Hydrogenedentota bacterium]|jgi:thiol-disulfide isomerase/thioredoxin
MSRIGTFTLGLITLAFGIIFAGAWLMMLTQGDAPWNSWGRSFEVAGIYVNLYVFLLLNAIALPVLTVSGWRTLQLAGCLPHHQGVQWASNVLVGIGLACLLIVLAYFRPWQTVLAGEPVVVAPSDERLNYPSLPLAATTDMNWELTSLDGAAVNLEDLRGKAIFLNIWATWCGYCIHEFPNILRLREVFEDHPNVAFLLVSNEEPETVRAWLDGPGKPWSELPLYTTEAFPDAYRPGGFPTTFFIAPDGRTAFRHSGFVAWDGEKTQAFLRQLAQQLPDLSPATASAVE